MNPERIAAIEAAWEKIKVFCKKYDGACVDDIQVRFQSDGYHWVEFGVTPMGVPYINFAGHNYGSRSVSSDWIGHPRQKEYRMDARYNYMENVIKSWPGIKKAIERKVEEENRLFNFEP